MCKIRKRSISVVRAICYKFMRYDIDVTEFVTLKYVISKRERKSLLMPSKKK